MRIVEESTLLLKRILKTLKGIESELKKLNENGYNTVISFSLSGSYFITLNTPKDVLFDSK